MSAPHSLRTFSSATSASCQERTLITSQYLNLWGAHDHALPPEVQAHFARQTGANVSRINSSHMSMVSQPEYVANLIEWAFKQSIPG